MKSLKQNIVEPSAVYADEESWSVNTPVAGQSHTVNTLKTLRLPTRPMTLKVVQREQGMYLVDIICEGQVKQVKENSKIIAWQNNITAAFDQDQRQSRELLTLLQITGNSKEITCYKIDIYMKL